MSTSTVGIKEALIEYLQHYVVKKKLTLREVESIEKLFEKHGKDDRIDKAIEWVDTRTMFETNDFKISICGEFKQYLQSIK